MARREFRTSRAQSQSRGTEHIAEHAPRVHAHQHVFLAGHFAAHQRQMVFGVQIAAVGNRTELAELGRDGAFRHAADEFLVLHPVADQVGHGEHLQVVALAELHQLRHPRHGAVVVHDFADHAGRSEARPGAPGPRWLRSARRAPARRLRARAAGTCARDAPGRPAGTPGRSPAGWCACGPPRKSPW